MQIKPGRCYCYINIRIIGVVGVFYSIVNYFTAILNLAK
jgi:hypothetical protein